LLLLGAEVPSTNQDVEEQEAKGGEPDDILRV